MAKLLTFDAAQNWLTSRVNVPTGMSAAQLAMAPDFPAQVRMHAFFSAKVAQVDVLDELRQEIDRYMAGGTNMAGARERLKNFLARQGVAHPDDVAEAEEPPAGVSPDDWKARKQITNLASTRRLNLILEQNANMAHAIGQREVSMQPAVQQRWPYYRYIAVQDGNARDSHAALHNMVLRKDDPFWATHTPPWEFGCRCQLEDCDAEEAAQYGGVAQAVTHEQPDGAQTATVQSGAGQTVNVLPSPSGFVFRPAEAFGTPDWDRIPDGPLKQMVRQQMATLPLAKKAVKKAAAKLAKLPVPTLAADEGALQAAEKLIVKNQFETCVVVNPDGSQQFSKKGAKYSVSFTPQEVAQMKDRKVTHNHPRGYDHPAADPRHRGNSFSPDDVFLAVEANAAEMRAVSPAWLHIMRRPQIGWPLLDDVRSAYFTADASVKAKNWTLIQAGKLPIAEAEAEHFHEVWTTVQQTTNIGYERRARA